MRNLVRKAFPLLVALLGLLLVTPGWAQAPRFSLPEQQAITAELAVAYQALLERAGQYRAAFEAARLKMDEMARELDQLKRAQPPAPPVPAPPAGGDRVYP